MALAWNAAVARLARAPLAFLGARSAAAGELVAASLATALQVNGTLAVLERVVTRAPIDAKAPERRRAIVDPCG